MKKKTDVKTPLKLSAFIPSCPISCRWPRKKNVKISVKWCGKKIHWFNLIWMLVISEYSFFFFFFTKDHNQEHVQTWVPSTCDAPLLCSPPVLEIAAASCSSALGSALPPWKLIMARGIMAISSERAASGIKCTSSHRLDLSTSHWLCFSVLHRAVIFRRL